jgi:hypothetical protein
MSLDLAARKVPMVMSQLNIRPVFDVNADVQGRDMKSAADAIQQVIAEDQPGKFRDEGHAFRTNRDHARKFFGTVFGHGLAVVLVYLLMVIKFQSWLDPVIVLMAVPFALGGVMWMLYLTQTHISVPALMGTLMCIGLTTANSILVVTFANDRMAAGDDAARRGDHRRIHASAPRFDDRRCHDSGHDPHGPGRRRRRRAKRPTGPRRHRRPAFFCHVCHAGFCAESMYRLLRRRRGWYQSTIYARVNGYVKNWTADIGDKVTKGQVLATIDTPDLDAQLQAAQQQLAVAQSEVQVAQANADFAKTHLRTLERIAQGRGRAAGDRGKESRV